MNFLMYLVVITVVSMMFYQYLRQYNRTLYSVTSVVAILSILFSKFDVFEVITDGHLGLACLVLVMYIGILSKKNRFTKRLWMIRTELSIIGFLLISAHVQHELPIRFHKWDSMTGLIVYIIMIPLFITSFKKIKRMIGRHWKDIHKLSYLAYLMIFIHLYYASSSNRRVTYFIVFGVYTTIKLYRMYQKRKTRVGK